MKRQEQKILGVGRPLLRGGWANRVRRRKPRPAERRGEHEHVVAAAPAKSANDETGSSQKAGGSAVSRISGKSGIPALAGNPGMRDMTGVLTGRFRANPCFAMQCTPKLRHASVMPQFAPFTGSPPASGIRTRAPHLTAQLAGLSSRSGIPSLDGFIARPLAERRALKPHLQIGAQRPAERAEARAIGVAVASAIGAVYL